MQKKGIHYQCMRLRDPAHTAWGTVKGLTILKTRKYKLFLQLAAASPNSEFARMIPFFFFFKLSTKDSDTARFREQIQVSKLRVPLPYKMTGLPNL